MVFCYWFKLLYMSSGNLNGILALIPATIFCVGSNFELISSSSMESIISGYKGHTPRRNVERKAVVRNGSYF